MYIISFLFVFFKGLGQGVKVNRRKRWVSWRSTSNAQIVPKEFQIRVEI